MCGFIFFQIPLIISSIMLKPDDPDVGNPDPVNQGLIFKNPFKLKILDVVGWNFEKYA